MSEPIRCEVCGIKFQRRSHRGPRPKSCSAACRQKAYRNRTEGSSLAGSVRDFADAHRERLRPFQVRALDVAADTIEGIER